MVIEKRRLHPILILFLGIFFLSVLYRLIANVHFKLINNDIFVFTKKDVIVYLIIFIILCLVGLILYSNIFLRSIKFNIDYTKLTIKEKNKTIHFLIKDIEYFNIVEKNVCKNSGLNDKDLKEIYSFISVFQNDLLGMNNGLQLYIKAKDGTFFSNNINSKYLGDLISMREQIMSM